jgi:hypothetical protein
MNVIEELHPPRPTPEQLKEAGSRQIAVPFPSAIVSHWERSSVNKAESNVKVLLRLYSPGGAQILEVEQVLSLENTGRARIIANLPGVLASEAGIYTWQLLLSGKRAKVLGEVSYEVAYIDSPADLDKLLKTARENAAISGRLKKVRANSPKGGAKSRRHPPAH